MTVAVGIFAHQEERRIRACLASLPLDRADMRFHVLVNGSTDGTADRAREVAREHPRLIIHQITAGGKSRTWNHFVHDVLTGEESAVICMDGDAEILGGSFDALVEALARPGVNAAAGMPVNGRAVERYQRELHVDGGLFGDLYGLSGDFVRRIRALGLRLPDDLIGDDGLVGAWAHTDLGRDENWALSRIVPCDEAGFRCEPVSLASPATWRMQYRRMINYSVRFFQNRIISEIMAREGPEGLPSLLSVLYPEWVGRFVPRRGLAGWFDRKALERMRAAR